MTGRLSRSRCLRWWEICRSCSCRWAMARSTPHHATRAACGGFVLRETCTPCGLRIPLLSREPATSGDSRSARPGWFQRIRCGTLRASASGLVGLEMLIEGVNVLSAAAVCRGTGPGYHTSSHDQLASCEDGIDGPPRRSKIVEGGHR